MTGMDDYLDGTWDKLLVLLHVTVAGGEDECQLRDCLRSAIGPARFSFQDHNGRECGFDSHREFRLDVYACMSM